METESKTQINKAKPKHKTTAIKTALCSKWTNKTCAYLLTAAPADSGSVLDASPQLISLLQEAGKLPPPVLAQSPWKNFILALLLVLLHGVGKITAGRKQELKSER